MHLDGGSMFGNTPKALWEKWMPADDRNRILLASRCLLVQTDDGRNILFEVGVGSFFDPKMKERYGITETDHMLLKNLEKAEIKETDIDGVVLSHLHFDHAGGLLSAYGNTPKLLFSKAKYYMGKEHWARAQNPHIRERVSFIPHLHELLAASARVVLIDQSTHPDLNFGVTFHFSHGHTIGLMIAQIESIAFVSDLIPGMPWVHLPITMGYDRYPELLVDEKKQLLQKLAQMGGAAFFTHDPQTVCGKISVNEVGKFKCTPTSLDQL